MFRVPEANKLPINAYVRQLIEVLDVGVTDRELVAVVYEDGSVEEVKNTSQDPETFRVELDEKPVVIAHTHPDGGGPSDEDYQGLVDGVLGVVVDTYRKNVWVYNKQETEVLMLGYEDAQRVGMKMNRDDNLLLRSDQIDIRLECLSRAVQHHGLANHADHAVPASAQSVIKTSRAFYEYVVGETA